MSYRTRRRTRIEAGADVYPIRGRFDDAGQPPSCELLLNPLNNEVAVHMIERRLFFSNLVDYTMPHHTQWRRRLRTADLFNDGDWLAMINVIQTAPERVHMSVVVGRGRDHRVDIQYRPVGTNAQVHEIELFFRQLAEIPPNNINDEIRQWRDILRETTLRDFALRMPGDRYIEGTYARQMLDALNAELDTLRSREKLSTFASVMGDRHPRLMDLIPDHIAPHVLPSRQ